MAYRVIMRLDIREDSIANGAFPEMLYLVTDDPEEALEYIKNAWAMPGVRLVEVEQ